MNATDWLIYAIVTAVNVALAIYNIRTSRWCRGVMREVPQRLAIAWNNGYIQGVRDEANGNPGERISENPYIDGPAMREWREGGAA